MSKRQKPNERTVSEPLPATLRDGTVVTGTLWLHPSRKGSFEVEYKGARKSDGHIDYTHEGYIKVMARIVLRELVEEIRSGQVLLP